MFARWKVGWSGFPIILVAQAYQRALAFGEYAIDVHETVATEVQ